MAYPADRPFPESSRSEAQPCDVTPFGVEPPATLVRDLPDDVHARLMARAAEHGQSLQQHLAGELRRLAERPTMDEVLARIAARRGGTVGLEQAVSDLAAERARS